MYIFSHSLGLHKIWPTSWAWKMYTFFLSFFPSLSLTFFSLVSERSTINEKKNTAVGREKLHISLFFFLMVSKSFCTPSAAPCMQRTPWCITAVTCWNITSCLLSALPGSGWEQNPTKCDLHFLNRWKVNINRRVWKRQNPDTDGWETCSCAMEYRQELSENSWQLCPSRCYQPKK